MVSKKEVEVDQSWSSLFKELMDELLTTIKTAVIIVGLVIIVLGLVYYTPKIFSYLFGG